MENDKKFKTLYLIIIFICFISLWLFSSCKSTKVLSDNGTGTEQYRETESEIRDGETELAITGAELENDSERLGTELSELEQSIRDSETNEQELGEIIQSVRERELTEDKLIELGIIGKE